MRLVLCVGIALVLTACGEDQQVQQRAQSEHILEVQTETKSVDSTYNDTVASLIDSGLYSKTELESRIDAFDDENCKYHSYINTEEAIQHACQLVANARAKLKGYDEQRITKLIKSGVPSEQARRVVIQKDIRVGDDLGALEGYGAISDIRTYRSVTGETTAYQFKDGTIAYVRNGKVIGVSF